MFKAKKTLSDTIGKINAFIQELEDGIKDHIENVNSIESQIKVMYENKTDLQSEISHAKKLIGNLSGNNS